MSLVYGRYVIYVQFLLPRLSITTIQKLSNAAETRSYTELAVTDGYDRGFEGGNTLDVGIDIRYVF